MPGIELTANACNGHVVVALCGDLDVTGAAGAEAAITALVARGQHLVIDMSALDFIDCSSLGALLRVQGLASAAAVMWCWRRRSRLYGGSWP
jgi:anti-anti-sigma factor